MKCRQCGAKMNPVEAMLNLTCGKCCDVNARKATQEGILDMRTWEFIPTGGSGDTEESHLSARALYEDCDCAECAWYRGDDPDYPHDVLYPA